jgi:hypothetical protein
MREYIITCRNEIIMNGTLKQCLNFKKDLFKIYPNHEKVQLYVKEDLTLLV